MDAEGDGGVKTEGDSYSSCRSHPGPPPPRRFELCGRSRNALGNRRNCLGTRGRTDSSGSTPR